jgi:beta-galactosidase/beta-glucuronidase
MFRLSGIFRDVYLWSAADIDLRDFEIKAGLADDFQTGTFNLDAIIDNRSDQSAEVKITITLTAPDGRIINAPPAAAVVPAGKSTTSISIENVGKVQAVVCGNAGSIPLSHRLVRRLRQGDRPLPRQDRLPPQ